MEIIPGWTITDSHTGKHSRWKGQISMGLMEWWIHHSILLEHLIHDMHILISWIVIVTISGIPKKMNLLVMYILLISLIPMTTFLVTVAMMIVNNCHHHHLLLLLNFRGHVLLFEGEKVMNDDKDYTVIHTWIMIIYLILISLWTI